jgi:hypothetical protein
MNVTTVHRSALQVMSYAQLGSSLNGSTPTPSPKSRLQDLYPSTPTAAPTPSSSSSPLPIATGAVPALSSAARRSSAGICKLMNRVGALVELTMMCLGGEHVNSVSS